MKIENIEFHFIFLTNSWLMSFKISSIGYTPDAVDVVIAATAGQGLYMGFRQSIDLCIMLAEANQLNAR